MGQTVAELFAGVGGFRLGLEDAGWDVIWSNQWEPKIQAQHASDCYVHHFGPEDHINEDIHEVPADDIPDHDLLCGGFPCQDYSVATTLDKAKGLEGKKGVLWWQIFRILREKRPPYVLLENVNRLLRSPREQRGRDFGVLLRCMSMLGYSVEWRMINAAHYGYPQRRRRVFILAAHEDTDLGRWIHANAADAEYLVETGFFPREFPVVHEAMEGLKASDAVLPEDIEEVSDSFEFDFDHAGVMADREIWTRRVTPDKVEPTTLGDILQSDVPERYFIPEEKLEKWKYAKGAKNEKRVADNGHEYTYSEGGMNFPDPLDKPARTILTSEGGTTGARAKHAVQDPETGRLRTLTPLEVERIMGFPPGWTDTGMPETWRYTCMGNALVVGLVEQMGERLDAMIEEPNRPRRVDAEAGVSL